MNSGPYTTTRFTEAFQKEVKQLNPRQKKAINAIEGPVLVVAGPGTGKTQVLAMRIGNILMKTDTAPRNILCLTFTDAGALEMRKRLQRFIGPDAYKVNVHTFHSFCNQIIQENQEMFSEFLDLLPVSDLEIARMFRQTIDELPFENPLRRLRGNFYYEARRMQKLYSLMKRESWSPEYLLDSIRKELSELKSDPAVFYQTTTKDHKPGDPKPDYFKKKFNMEVLQAAVEAYTPFQERMKSSGRYDFDDMIHWVLQAFKTDTNFLAAHQENYLYILVDEYQDTNGSQNQILELLCDFWDRPNLFIVGDDDQAIFRFQGANINNLVQLYEKYDPEVIVLDQNYRSTQHIIDVSSGLIRRNNKRITNQIPGIKKEFTASADYAHAPIIPEIKEYVNRAHEETDLVKTILSLKEKEVSLNEIAVIYRKHAQAENLLKVLTQKGVPVEVKSRLDILHQPLIRNLINILKFLQGEFENPGNADHLLFEIMHYSYFDLSLKDVGSIASHGSTDRFHRKPYRTMLRDKEFLASIGVNNVDAIIEFESLLNHLVRQIPHITLQVLFERLLKDGHVIREIMKSEQSTFYIQLLATFFNHLKAETKKDPTLTLKGLLRILDEMIENGLPLQLHSIIRSREGVNFLTAHGAKGMQFDYVFLLGCTKKNWQVGGRSWHEYTLPSSLRDPSKESDIEDERRLFYVSITRARKHLTVSYPEEKLNGLVEHPAQFIAEIIKEDIIEPKEQEVTDMDTSEFYLNLLQPVDKTVPLIDHGLIDRHLERFRLSPTALNVYLQCPRKFYFEHILKVPRASNPYTGFGMAVHRSLQLFLEELRKQSAVSGEHIVTLFSQEMPWYRSHFTEEGYDNYLRHGENVLPGFVDQNMERWKGCSAIFPEVPINAIFRDVPLRGKIDLIEQDEQGKILVLDFKTGNVSEDWGYKNKIKPPKDWDDPGGDYWRQITFYKILLEASDKHNFTVTNGKMSFVEPNNLGEYRNVDFILGPEYSEIVANQIIDANERIRNHEFDETCGSKDCVWCNFVQNDFILPDQSRESEENDNHDANSTDEDFSPEQLELEF